MAANLESIGGFANDRDALSGFGLTAGLIQSNDGQLQLRTAAHGPLVLRCPRPVIVPLGFLFRISGCILHIAPRFLGLALHLLGRAIDLRVCVTCPLTNLPLYAASSIVHRTLDFVLIHIFTLRDPYNLMLCFWHDIVPVPSFPFLVSRLNATAHRILKQPAYDPIPTAAPIR
jgi:hypothetical protein